LHGCGHIATKYGARATVNRKAEIERHDLIELRVKIEAADDLTLTGTEHWNSSGWIVNTSDQSKRYYNSIISTSVGIPISVTFPSRHDIP
jgi:hypothetical protein